MKIICSVLILIAASSAAQASADCRFLLSHFAIATAKLESTVDLLKGLGFRMIDESFTTTWDKPWGELVDGLYGRDVHGRTKRVRYARMLWPSEGTEFWKSANSIVKDGVIPPEFQPVFAEFPEFFKFLGGPASTLTKTLREMGASLTGGQLGIEVFEVADSNGKIEQFAQPLLHYAFFVEKDEHVQNVVDRLSSKGWEVVFPREVTMNTETVFMKMLDHEGDFANRVGVVEIRKFPWPQPSAREKH